MSIAEFVNKIVATLPGVVFTGVEDWECLFATVDYAHHKYAISYETQFEVSEMVCGLDDPDTWVRNTFSSRIEGLLNGLRRNEAGEMVKPVEVDCGSH